MSVTRARLRLLTCLRKFGFFQFVQHERLGATQGFETRRPQSEGVVGDVDLRLRVMRDCLRPHGEVHKRTLRYFSACHRRVCSFGLQRFPVRQRRSTQGRGFDPQRILGLLHAEAERGLRTLPIQPTRPGGRREHRLVRRDASSARRNL